MHRDPDFYATFVSGTRDYRAFQLSGECITLLIIRLIGPVSIPRPWVYKFEWFILETLHTHIYIINSFQLIPHHNYQFIIHLN
jgi:hypothetical protein